MHMYLERINNRFFFTISDNFDTVKAYLSLNKDMVTKILFAGLYNGSINQENANKILRRKNYKIILSIVFHVSTFGPGYEEELISIMLEFEPVFQESISRKKETISLESIPDLSMIVGEDLSTEIIIRYDMLTLSNKAKKEIENFINTVDIIDELERSERRAG